MWRKKPKTAAEFAADLQADSSFVTRRQELDQTRQEETQQHRLVALPIMEELQQAGFPFESLDELRRSGIVYKAAVPILLKWLSLISDVGVQESIVRALSVPWAKPKAAVPLIALFLDASTGSSGLKWAVGNALEVVADESVFDQLCELARDRRHGTARQMIVLALRKAKNPRAVDVLIELLEDDEVSGHALSSLSKLKTEKARPHIERFLDDPRAWVRREATRALARLDN